MMEPLGLNGVGLTQKFIVWVPAGNENTQLDEAVPLAIWFELNPHMIPLYPMPANDAEATLLEINDVNTNDFSDNVNV